MMFPIQFTPFNGDLTYVEYTAAGVLSTVTMLAVFVWVYTVDSEEDQNIVQWLVHSRSTGRYFNLWLSTIILWVGPMAIKLLTHPSDPIAIFLYQFGKAAAYFIPPTFMLFGFSYAEREDVVERFRIKEIFFTISGAFAFLALTNTWFHNIMWTGYVYETTPFPRLVQQRNTMFWVAFWYTTIFYLLPFPYMIKYAMEMGRKAKKQMATIAIALQLGGLMLIVGHFGIGPLVSDLKYGGIFSGFAGALIGFSLYRYELFNISPVARKTAFEEMDEGIISLDDNRNIVDFNEKAAEIAPALTNNVGEFIDNVLPEIVADADADDTADHYKDEVNLFKEDERRVIDIEPDSIIENDEFKGEVLILNDVTETVEYANDLEQQTEQLEQFASIVSHDLRNPLSVAKGRMDIIKDGVDDVETIEDIEAMFERMDSIIDETLTLTREGQAIEERSLESLNDIAATAWETSKNADATFQNRVHDETLVYTDPGGDRLQRALENLYRNAIDHGGDDVTIRVGTMKGGFYVEDDGPGVPEEDRDKIFDQGFTTGGTGLGLAIVQQIVEAHGWDIRVTEGRDGGAKFEIVGVDLVREDSAGTDTDEIEHTPADAQPADD